MDNERKEDRVKTIACVPPGTIVEGTALKSGKISEKDRKDVTKECIIAMMQHISCIKQFQEEGVAGYAWDKEGGGKVQLILYDTDKYTLVPNETENDEESIEK